MCKKSSLNLYVYTCTVNSVGLKIIRNNELPRIKGSLLVKNHKVYKTQQVIESICSLVAECVHIPIQVVLCAWNGNA